MTAFNKLIPSKTNESEAKDNDEGGEVINSTGARSSFRTTLNFIRGEVSSLIHVDQKSLSISLLDFNSGKFLKKYFTEIASKEGGRKVKLPTHSVIQTDDPGCIIVQSFRYSSVNDTVFRIVQRFTVSQTPSIVSDGKRNRERITIAFYTLPAKDVPANIPTTTYFEEHGIKILDDKYSETGHFTLTSASHSQTATTLVTEIGFNPSLLNLTSLSKRMQSALDIVKFASEFYDRSDFIDEAERIQFITHTIPHSPNLTRNEQRLIDKSIALIDNPFVRIPNSLKKDSSIEMFHILSSEQSAWGKGVGIIDTSPEECLAWFYRWCSNSRMVEHEKYNGNVIRVSTEIEDSRSMIVSSVEMFSGVSNRIFHS